MKLISLKSCFFGFLVFSHCTLYAQSVKNQKELNLVNLNFKSEIGPNGYKRCGTMEAEALLRANNPNMPTLLQDELWLQDKIREYKEQQALNSNAKATLLTIPVVVHVIHNGDPVGSNENIDDAQVLSQIQVLNEDFRKMVGTPGFNNHPAGADIEVEFCLAAIDPNGLPTNGIDRVDYGQNSFSGQNSVNSMKTATYWNPNDYMNIWVVNFGNSGLLGFAQFPNSSGLGGMNNNNGSADTDGVVADYRSFGSSDIYPAGNFSAPYDLGRTMTHEVGHFLGLRHIWGDSNCGNDFCSDTPESSGSNYGCPTQTTCDGIQDMVENYMDYTNDACMNIFTEDQKTRIRTVFQVSPRRASLTSSTVCQLLSDPDDIGVSSIVSPNGSDCGEGFVPEVVVTNYGSNDVTSFTIIYDIDGGASSSQSWTGTLTPGNSVNVTLPYITSTGTHIFNAFTISPNGTLDSNSGNDANSSNYSLIGGGATVTFTLSTDCWGHETYWELKDANNVLVYSGGNISVTIPPGGLQSGTQQGDAGAYESQSTISEQWCLDDGCYDFVIYDDYGDGIDGSSSFGCFVDGDYSITDQWGGVFAELQQTDFGNSESNEFCVNLSVKELSNNDVKIFPNPSQGTFNVVMNDCTGEVLNVRVTDLSGRVVLDSQFHSNVFQVNLSDVASGSYTMTITTSLNRTSNRLIIKR
ncbi:MAG: M43 family zinc metalloprotease [Crocinitomicaceae bacterium]|nr:M43 family zinc metalloprotease [Crocinitomicaceae bacterium]